MTASTTAAVFNGPGEPFELREIPIPELREGELLVEITLCTICGSDLHTFTGRRNCECPTILGHEITGRVVESAGDVADMSGRILTTGDRITWSIAASCGCCFPCSHQIPQKCDALVKYGHAPLNDYGPTGGLARHCRLLPGTSICRLPDSLDDNAACPVNCCTATAAAALRTAGSVAGSSVLVLGAGSLGLTAAAMSLQQDSDLVCVADIDESRLKRAESLTGCVALPVDGDTESVRRTLHERTNGRGADVVLEMTGSTDAAELGIDALRIGGRLILVGAVFPGRPLELSAETVVRRMLRIEGVHNYRPDDLATAVNFLENVGATSPVRTLVEREFALTEADAAFQFAIENRPLRVAVRP